MNPKITALILITSLAFTVGCMTSTSAIKYDRKNWGNWIDLDKDCQNARHELLIKESLVPVALSTNGCRALTGKWIDFYTGEILTDSTQIEIDHVVPIKLAHDLGGALWTKEQKQKYYNDTGNLVLTSKKNNAQKGANDITMWQPANKERACNQAKKWVLIKRRYGLEITPTEAEYLKLLTNCELPGLI